MLVKLTAHSTAGNNGKWVPVLAVSASKITTPTGSLAVDAVADTAFTITLPKRLYSGATPTERYWTAEDYGQDSDGSDQWATEDETRDQIIGFYRRTWEHSDATINELPLNAPGHVPWWLEPYADTNLFAIMVHVLGESIRHTGHADILRVGCGSPAAAEGFVDR
jgi:hypothetical protein